VGLDPARPQRRHRGADPTDPATYPESAAVVLVASDDPARNVAAAEAARRHYPDAMIVAHVGTNPTAAQQEALEAAVADRVVDPVEAVVSRVCEATGVDADEEPVRLLRVLRSLTGPLLVVAHEPRSRRHRERTRAGADRRVGRYPR